MAGVFSGHLLETFQTAQRALIRGPFGQPLPSKTSISVHGPMSFAPHTHGTFPAQSSFFQDTTLVDSEMSDETAKNIATMQAKLNKKLGPEYISQRPGPSGGPKLTYAEGWKIINLANEVFGFNGWSSQVISLTTDFIDCNEQSQRYSVGATAIVRVTLRDGVFHEDVGYGLLENSKSKGAALDKCKKEAVTDAVKRSLRNFGNLLGNCLYDKSYTQEVVKMKVPPPKFSKDDLHRRPEFEDSKVGTAADPSTSASSSVFNKPTTTSINRPASPAVKSEATSRMEAILNACNTSAGHNLGSTVPPHMRSTSGQAGPIAASTPNVKGEGAAAVDASSAGASAPSHVVAPTIQNRQPKHRRPNETSTIDASGTAQPRNPKFGQRCSGQPPHEDRRVSFTPQPAASTSTSAVAAPPPAPLDIDVDVPDDTSEFHFNSEDDAFLAEVDLGEEGIGGPINFDEGVGRLEAGEDSREEVHDSRYVGQPQPRQRLHPPHPQHPPDPRVAKLPQPQYAGSDNGSTSHRYQTATTRNHTAHQSSRDTSITPIAQSPLTMGGFHFPRASSTSNPHISNPKHTGQAAQPNYAPSAGGSSVGLKRTADVMQGNYSTGAGSRRPVQGMGLVPPPGPDSRHGAQGVGAQGHRREVLGALEVSEGGDVKRMRR